ncbi:predicted protein [Lichtheimia corymbifera JMRC:FSU:9682]|uniref:Uncharacterized protein n=1 Tax=Lichtheimia corymbifera JMRC:FSU:9682 TaxID=1263082 RepID=A0A068S0I0_9FUNG|nr:predicted protein [Lichtheimia corymbifera JMRC:FSU:9682]
MVNVWNDVTEQPILVIKSGTCADVVADSTHRIQQCIQDQLTHLDNRARALASSGNFEAALVDVARIRQLGPFTAVGYLCAGHVYSLQGRQKAAIDIYEQGLDAVPLLDPSYQQLVEARSMAQERDSTRIDFIKEFPIDIIANIAPWILSQGEMKPREIQEYLNVSRVWREKLLFSVRDLHVESTANDDLGSDDDLLEHLAPRCTALTLQNHAIEFPRLMLKAPFPSLQTLIAKGPTRGDDETVGRTIDALANLGSTLTHLEVQSFAYGGCLGQILSSCPNLAHLNMRSVDIRMDSAPECHTNLKTLLFSHFDYELDIHEITKRLPGLHVFAADPFYHFKDVKLLQDNCPNLKVIGCNDYDGSYIYIPTTTTSSHDGDDNDVGVHTFFIDHDGANDFFVHLEDLMDFMRRNSHTLQHVYFYIPLPSGRLGGDDNDDDAYDTTVLDHAIQATGVPLFTKMTTYTQYVIEPRDILMARWVARESPHLTKMEISMYDAGELDTSALFDDLIGRCELESIILEVNGNPTTMDMGGIERFIRYHGTFDSLLHTLILPNHIRLCKDALEALTTLPRLENLSISWPLMKENEGDNNTKSGGSQFIGKLDRLHRLQLSSDDFIPDDVFVQLSKLNITSLELYMPTFFKSSNSTALLSLLQCPNLQELHIRPFYRGNDPHIEGIRTMLASKIGIITGM